MSLQVNQIGLSKQNVAFGAKPEGKKNKAAILAGGATVGAAAGAGVKYGVLKSKVLKDINLTIKALKQNKMNQAVIDYQVGLIKKAAKLDKTVIGKAALIGTAIGAAATGLYLLATGKKEAPEQAKAAEPKE